MNTTPVATKLASLAVAFGLSGCAVEPSDHPPVLTSSGTDNPVVCDRLNDAQSPPVIDDFGAFWVEGRRAGCVADGQQCVVPWASGHCDAQLAVAQCVDNAWQVTCAAGVLPDGSGGSDGNAADAEDSGIDAAQGSQ